MMLNELDWVASPVCDTATPILRCGVLVVQRFVDNQQLGRPTVYNIYLYGTYQQAAHALDNRSRNSPPPVHKWVELGELEAQMVLFEVTKDEAI